MEEEPSVSAILQDLDRMRDCANGNHAWLPWLTLHHPDPPHTIRGYWTKCGREGCRAEESFDL